MHAAGARLLPALGLLGLALLAACQDPSGVGLGLIGEEGNEPNVTVLPADSVYLTDQPDFTGGYADGTTPVQQRVLVGAVMDATFGDASAAAYVDVRPPNTTPSGFLDRTITSATLRLVRDYVYGDSTSTLDLALYEVADAWSPVNAESDTVFDVGQCLATYDVTASDTLVTLPLPSSWVSANDAALRGDSVLTDIHGFALRLEEGAPGGAVVGFDATRSRLRLTTAQDTVDYLLREVFTHVERGAPAPPSGDLLFLRGGASEGIAVTLPYDEVGASAVSRAVFRLTADPSELDAGMLSRSLPETLGLVGVTASGSKILLASATPDEDTDTYTFSSGTLTNVVQDAVVGNQLYERYLIIPSQSPATLDVLPTVTGPAPGQGESERRPRLVLTVVPAAD